MSNTGIPSRVPASRLLPGGVSYKTVRGGCDSPHPRCAAVASPDMPSRRGLRPQPRSYLAPGGCWPDGPLEDGAPPEAVLALDISKRFRDHIDRLGWNRSEAARRAGISRTTVLNILGGKTWLDLPTIDRLERNLGMRLWNRDHHRRR